MIRNFFRNFMTGRYGPDHLNIALVVVSLLLYLLSFITGIRLVLYLSYALLALSVFRMLSRSIQRRRRENDRFIRYWWPIKTKFKRFVEKIRSRKTHRFFKCPSCGNTLRVPRGKGKLQITCPKCGERFVKKT